MEEYLTICIVLLLKLCAIDFTNWFESTSSLFALMMVTLAISLPIWIWKFLSKHHQKIYLQDRKFRKLYGPFIDGQEHRRKMSTLYNVNFTLRRIGYAILIVMVPHYNWLQT